MDPVAMERYLPMGLAGAIFLGCILPFSGTASLLGSSINVFTLPTTFRQLGALIGAGPIPLLAYAIYLIPLMAIVILLNGLAGAVDKRRQVIFGVANILLCVLLPGLIVSGVILTSSSEIARAGRDFGKQMGWTPLDFIHTDLGAGGWLIVIASIGLILSGLGKIKIAR
jgi:hypothetical protein